MTDHVQNARVTDVKIGHAHHDWRGFFTIMFGSNGWGQGCCPPFTPEFIDKFIEVCGADNLFDCKGALVRVIWSSDAPTGPIMGVRHIVNDDCEVRW